jgi:hypothetical protein
MTSDNDFIAPKDKVWVCLACGKQAKDRIDGGISYGWDASCFLNSGLYFKDELTIEDGMVVRIKERSSKPDQGESKKERNTHRQDPRKTSAQSKPRTNTRQK